MTFHIEKFMSEGAADFLEKEKFLHIEDDRVRLHLNLFYDTRHSWLEVPIMLLAVLNCQPEDFTKFSYIDKERSLFYLEEDVDAGLFLGFLGMHPTEEDSILEWLHVKPKNLGSRSQIRELESNFRGGSIH